MTGRLALRRSAKAGCSAGRMRIGFVNNMPAAAVRATERQFREALKGEADLVCFSAEAGGLRPAQASSERRRPARPLRDLELDGLIVTGGEPDGGPLADEPLYGEIARIAEAAEAAALPTIFSCLAAHAAARSLRGVERWPLTEKLCGVFEVAPLKGPAVRIGRTPHSRWNEVRAEELETRGFEVLGYGEACGVDAFALKGGGSLLFLQGHPEYEAASLLLEHRRDLGRARLEERPPPKPPLGYFSKAGEAELLALRAAPPAAARDRAVEARLALEAAALSSDPWRPWAERLFSDWLSALKRGPRAAQGG